MSLPTMTDCSDRCTGRLGLINNGGASVLEAHRDRTMAKTYG